MRIYKTGTADEAELVAEMRSRTSRSSGEAISAASEIMENVRARGWEAVCEYSLRFDGAEPYELDRAALEAARARCGGGLISALERAAENIRDYQSRLLPGSVEWQARDGVRLGRIVRGLDKVGIYVPGGAAAYPSSVLMTAIPAKVAGVGEVIMATPPTKHLNDAVLAAALIAGVDRVIAVGGVQAVAALTYGCGIVPKVDKLVGPGNAYVAAAKQLAFGELDIDMIAGPSEVLIIADNTANANWLAADLLSQAEHDPLAAPILLTDDESLANDVERELELQMAQLERREIIARSIENCGAIVICSDLTEAVRISNLVAPEHLEIATAEPRTLLDGITNAGAVFLGAYTPEPVGDYIAGPSHVLPTAGSARFFSPLSVDSFIKTSSILEYDRQALRGALADITAIANSEGLTAHASAISIRFEEER